MAGSPYGRKLPAVGVSPPGHVPISISPFCTPQNESGRHRSLRQRRSGSPGCCNGYQHQKASPEGLYGGNSNTFEPTLSRGRLLSSSSANRLARTSSLSPSRCPSSLPPTMLNPEGRGRKLPATPIRRPNLPSKRLEAMLNRFSCIVLPIHLNVVNQHIVNIEKLMRLSNVNGIRLEVEECTKAVHALGTLMFEMEIIRTHLEPNELPYFDACLTPAQSVVLNSLSKLQALCPSPTSSSIPARGDSDRSAESGLRRYYRKLLTVPAERLRCFLLPNGLLSGKSSSTSDLEVASGGAEGSSGHHLHDGERHSSTGNLTRCGVAEKTHLSPLVDNLQLHQQPEQFGGSCHDVQAASSLSPSPSRHRKNGQHLNSRSPTAAAFQGQHLRVGTGPSSHLNIPTGSSPCSSAPGSPKTLKPKPLSPLLINHLHQASATSPRRSAATGQFLFPPGNLANKEAFVLCPDYVPPSPLQLWQMAGRPGHGEPPTGDLSPSRRDPTYSKTAAPTTAASTTFSSPSTIASSKMATASSGLSPGGPCPQGQTNSGKKWPQSNGNGGANGGGSGGALEVLYEDPKEDLHSDVMSVFSCGLNDDDDDRRHLIEDTGDPAAATETGGSAPIRARSEPTLESSSTKDRSRVSKQCSSIFAIFASGSFSVGEGGEDPKGGDVCNGDPVPEVSEEQLQLDQSWAKLLEEVEDLRQLITEYSNVVNRKTSSASCSNGGSVFGGGTGGASNGQFCAGSFSDGRDISKSALYPVAGALLGTCIGGPVGLLAGVKIGGLAAIGGSVFGYSTGSIIKQQKDRQEYLDEFYSSHSPVPPQSAGDNGAGPPGASAPTSTAPNNGATGLRRDKWSTQRAHSLPDMTSSSSKKAGPEDDVCKGGGADGGRDPAAAGPETTVVVRKRSSLSRSNHNSSSTRKNYHVRFDLIAEDSKNSYKPFLPNHVVEMRRAQSARRSMTTRSADNLLC